MGRIKTQLIKRSTKRVLNEHPDSLKADFEENKTRIAEHLKISSKKLRNAIAGYASRLVKKAK